MTFALGRFASAKPLFHSDRLLVNPKLGQQDTLTHELAHQFRGDTRGLAVDMVQGLGRVDPFLGMLPAIVFNTAFDLGITASSIRLPGPQAMGDLYRYGLTRTPYNYGALQVQKLLKGR